MNLIFDTFYLFVFQPIIEHLSHHFLHKVKNKDHKLHHIQTLNNTLDIEIWCILSILFFYCYNFYYIYIGLIKYYIFHLGIHYKSSLVPQYLINHHKLHHHHPQYNFGISAVFPDIIFDTMFFKRI